MICDAGASQSFSSISEGEHIPFPNHLKGSCAEYQALPYLASWEEILRMGINILINYIHEAQDQDNADVERGGAQAFASCDPEVG